MVKCPYPLDKHGKMTNGTKKWSPSNTHVGLHCVLSIVFVLSKCKKKLEFHKEKWYIYLQVQDFHRSLLSHNFAKEGGCPLTSSGFSIMILRQLVQIPHDQVPLWCHNLSFKIPTSTCYTCLSYTLGDVHVSIWFIH